MKQFVLFSLLMCSFLSTSCSGGEKDNDLINTDSNTDKGTDADTDTDADSDTDTDADADLSPGCGLVPPSNGAYSLEASQGTRTYVLDVPSNYNPDTPYPIIFGFHGMGTSGSLFRSAFYGNLLSAMGDEVIVVHPDAIGDPTAWNTEVDVPFFDELLTYLQTVLCIDSSRIFATGHSSGGFFTNMLGCLRGDILRGIAPVSGGGPMVWGGNGCTGQVAAWIAHGENDETVAITSGEGSRDHWGESNSCNLSSSSPSSPAECVDYAECNAAYPVRWCVYQDGHNWPSFGPQGMWDFFKSLSRI